MTWSSGEQKLMVSGAVHVGEVVRTAPGQVAEVLLEAKARDGELPGLLARAGIPWRATDRAELVRLGGAEARLALALLRPFEYCDLDRLLRACPEKALLVALDSVTDPGNLGAILRSAAFFGVNGIILPERNSAQVNEAVLKRSAGAALSLPIARVTNLSRTLSSLKEAGFWVYGTAVAGGTPLAEETFAERTCLVLGNESTGMRRLVGEKCDVQLTLPGHFESLNVAAFAAVALFQWFVGSEKVSKKP
jgi:23S rRNA (guanosine2251-2'-O)-methyltransferase